MILPKHFFYNCTSDSSPTKIFRLFFFLICTYLYYMCRHEILSWTSALASFICSCTKKDLNRLFFILKAFYEKFSSFTQRAKNEKNSANTSKAKINIFFNSTFFKISRIFFNFLIFIFLFELTRLLVYFIHNE